ncbi:MAG: hypothetical protein RL701_6921, partial [Pseudomonadota bacterium]
LHQRHRRCHRQPGQWQECPPRRRYQLQAQACPQRRCRRLPAAYCRLRRSRHLHTGPYLQLATLAFRPTYLWAEARGPARTLMPHRVQAVKSPSSVANSSVLQSSANSPHHTARSAVASVADAQTCQALLRSRVPTQFSNTFDTTSGWGTTTRFSQLSILDTQFPSASDDGDHSLLAQSDGDSSGYLILASNRLRWAR